MRVSFRWAAIAACVFAILACTGLQAQSTSLTIAPTGYITAGLGRTLQFTAFLGSNTSQPDTNVTWSIGRPGMNNGLGSISSAGLYTAPTLMPSGGQVQINATDSATGISNFTFVYLLPAGPTLTGVTPSPIPTGTVTVTIQGSGF